MADYEVTQETADGYESYLVFNFRADLREASRPVEIDYGGEWDATPFQTADGGHDPKRIAELLMDWVGGDWYSKERPITVKEDSNG